MDGANRPCFTSTSSLHWIALQLDVMGTPVKLASIDDLIGLKQSVARPIDLADIEHLKRLPNP